MSSRHFLTIFWRRRTDFAVAKQKYQYHLLHLVQVDQDAMFTVDKEIIIWHILSKWDRGTTIVAQMEYSGFDPKPTNASACFWQIDRSRAYHRKYRAKATEMCLPWIFN